MVSNGLALQRCHSPIIQPPLTTTTPPLYCTWLTISLARASDSTICWHSFLRRTV